MQRSLASRTSNFQRIYLVIGVAVITLISLFIGFASYGNRLSELSSEQESNHLAAHNKTSSELQESGEQMIEHLLRLKLELITTGLIQPETPFDARAFETIFLQSIQDSNSLDQIRWIDLSGAGRCVRCSEFHLPATASTFRKAIAGRSDLPRHPQPAQCLRWPVHSSSVPPSVGGGSCRHDDMVDVVERNAEEEFDVLNRRDRSDDRICRSTVDGDHLRLG